VAQPKSYPLALERQQHRRERARHRCEARLDLARGSSGGGAAAEGGQGEGRDDAAAGEEGGLGAHEDLGEGLGGVGWGGGDVALLLLG